MAILKQENIISMLIPYEQLFIQTYYHKGRLITEQNTEEPNPHSNWSLTMYLRQQLR